MNKKIVLVHKWYETDTPEFPLGIAYLASYLRKYSDFSNIKIISSNKNIEQKIIDEKPDIVGFYSYTSRINSIIKIASEIKKKIQVPIILGGPHISSVPERLPKEFDIGVIGEGEETFLELVNVLFKQKQFNTKSLSEINGIVYHHNNKQIITKPREAVKDIDKFPFPARDLFDQKLMLKPVDPYGFNQQMTWIDIFTVRGCPFKCTYCQQAAFGHTLRLHSAEYVTNEIEHIYNTYKPQGISFSDDLFSINKNRLDKITHILEQKKLLDKLVFRVDVRANLVDDKLVESLKKLNVKSVSMGIETASERLLTKLKGGNVSMHHTTSAIEKLNNADIGIYGCLMIGAPDETLEEVKETEVFLKKFLKNHPRNTFNLNPLTPLPKTKVWDDCIKDGLIKEDIPWEEFDFSLEELKKRSYHICENISPKELIDTFERLYKLRRNRYYINLLKTNPYRFTTEILKSVKRKLPF